MEDIASEYKEYCSNVSKYGHPMSLQSVKRLIQVIGQLHRGGDQKPKVADFGSGFSSFAIRKYTDAENHSFDTSPDWLKKTKEYLYLKNQNCDNLFVYNRENVPEDMDMVIWDLGSSGFRVSEFMAVKEKFRNSVCVIDDCHDPSYIKMCKDLEKKDGWKLLEIQGDKDEFGRYVSILFGRESVYELYGEVLKRLVSYQEHTE